MTEQQIKCEATVQQDLWFILFTPLVTTFNFFISDPLDVSARSEQYSEHVKYKSLLSNWVSWFWGDGSQSNKERMS